MSAEPLGRTGRTTLRLRDNSVEQLTQGNTIRTYTNPTLGLFMDLRTAWLHEQAIVIEVNGNTYKINGGTEPRRDK